ncbi:hypothetical protein [Chitinophaga flava]|uniref:Uncharacterized protein n=1 Tax=Chitinophaga flava TaxID=2259036 RepID=A0A365XWB8_9BACT|nr:hypothetical protein [Chitinophaga flava]RBL90378.1 hypothetical protein DF182_28360 [Chitinophaga flava]
MRKFIVCFATGLVFSGLFQVHATGKRPAKTLSAANSGVFIQQKVGQCWNALSAYVENQDTRAHKVTVERTEQNPNYPQPYVETITVTVPAGGEVYIGCTALVGALPNGDIPVDFRVVADEVVK